MANGYFTPPVTSDSIDASEQTYIEALHTYTSHQQQQQQQQQ